MFSQTFVLACIASIASADVHSDDKLAEMKSNLAQTSPSQSQTFGLAQILAKSTTKATSGQCDGGNKKKKAFRNNNNTVTDEADTDVLLAQIEATAGECEGKHFTKKNRNRNNTVTDTGDLLAQIKAETGHTCHSSQDRNKAALYDFFGIYAGSVMYDDTDFMPDNDALYWADMGEDMSRKANKIEWKRASDAFPNYTLFGADGVHADDIEQGALGNCWFLAACATMAQIPGSVEEMFLNSSNEISANGIYAVNFYTLGMPHTVIVDDYLPLNDMGNTYFAGLGENADRGDAGSLWVPIVEKAFAKYHGNYEHIVGGDARAAARTMGNHPQDIAWHENDEEAGAANWTKLTQHADQGHILMAGTPGGNDNIENDDGLVQGHAYNVLGYVVLSDGTRLIKMQNPWASEYYVGDWSDSSDLWTETLKQEAGYVDRNDGVFFMSYEDYWSQCSETYYNFDAQNWSSASFLMLDDDTAVDGQAEHNLTLTSSVAQKIYLTAHTWDARCMADQCEDWDYDNSGNHSVYVQPAYWNYQFKYGARQIEFDIEADVPLNVRTRWDWSDERKANDWSVVAFGAEGTLTLTLDGYESDVMPVLGGTHDSENPNPPTPPTPPPSPPTPPPSPPMPPSLPTLEDFVQWAEDYEVDNWDMTDCGVALSEEYVLLDAENDTSYYRTIIKNTCPWVRMQVTVYMEEDNWDNITHFYSVENADGTLMKDSITKGKPKFDEDGYMGITFVIGKIWRPQNKGVTDQMQPIAGWECGFGDYGIRYYDDVKFI